MAKLWLVFHAAWFGSRGVSELSGVWLLSGGCGYLCGPTEPRSPRVQVGQQTWRGGGNGTKAAAQGAAPALRGGENKAGVRATLVQPH